MRIGIQSKSLTNKHQYRGIGRYTRTLIDALVKTQTCTVVEIDNAPSTNVDVIHYPYFNPFEYVDYTKHSKPIVVTIHDLIPITYRDFFPRGLRGHWHWLNNREKISAVDAIITDSYASRDDILQHTSIESRNISVIYLAVNPIYKPVSNEQLGHMRKKYNLPKEYILYVGDVNWNKNLHNLLLAIKKLTIPLVVVGKAFVDYKTKETQILMSEIESLGIDQRVIRLGFVPDEDMAAVYTAANATIVTSIAEGFGLPILESMACGTPCIVSNTSSMIEIAGPSLRVDPLSMESITNGIQKTLEVHTKNSKILVEWANTFTLERMARQTMQVYRKIAQV